MCGISASSGRFKYDLEKLMLLILYNQSRGEDSTGMWAQGHGIAKVSGPASETLLPGVQLPESNMVFVHNRQATGSQQGRKDKKNAHPFRYGKIVGCQNGGVKNGFQLGKKHELDYLKMDVDSMIIYAVMNKLKEKDPKSNYIEDTIKQIEGPMALVFTDEDQPDTLYCYRNSERPLYRGVIKLKKDEQQMYMSSIEDSLHAISCTDIQEFKENYLYKIQFGKIESTKLVKYVAEKPVYTPSTSNYGHQGHNSHVRNSALEKIDLLDELRKTYNDSVFSFKKPAKSYPDYQFSRDKKNEKVRDTEMLSVDDKCYITGGEFSGKICILKRLLLVDSYYSDNTKEGSYHITEPTWKVSVMTNKAPQPTKYELRLVEQKHLALMTTNDGKQIMSIEDLENEYKMAEIEDLTVGMQNVAYKDSFNVWKLGEIKEIMVVAEKVLIIPNGETDRQSVLVALKDVSLSNTIRKEVQETEVEILPNEDPIDNSFDPSGNFDSIEDIREALKELKVLDADNVFDLGEQVMEDFETLVTSLSNNNISREEMLDDVELYRQNILTFCSKYAGKLVDIKALTN